MPITQRNKIGMLEAMLFANAEPVEPTAWPKPCAPTRQRC